MKPDCKGECRFLESCTSQTDMYYPPIYNKFGRNTNPDMNITYGTVRCLTCNKRWSTATQGGSTPWTETKPEEDKSSW